MAMADTAHAGHDDHDHDHDHDVHDHEHGDGPLAALRELLPFGHGHSHSEANVDAALETSDRGIWALKVSLVGLGATALLQFVVVTISGSIALLADTIHNFSDMLTAIPLWIAFSLARKPASRRFTYGYGRAEDVAGVLILVVIAASAVVAAIESIAKLARPQAVTNLGWVALAALIGCAGNEAVAVFRMRVGREIGSAALIADGMHARADGLTSLAVLVGVAGVALGFPLADPIVGLVITIAILVILKDAAVAMWYRLMDAVDPALVDRIEQRAAAVEGVRSVRETRVRWLGHKLCVDLHVGVDAELTTRESHRILEEVRHALFHDQPRLTIVNVHADPTDDDATDHHTITAHHVTPRAAPRA